MARKFPRATTVAHRDTRGEPTGHYGATHEGTHRGEANRRARIEIEFDEQSVLGALFGQFDTNLVLIENRLGVYISARGNKALVEGPVETVARARDVLRGMYQRILSGQEIDAGTVDSLIAMSNEPTLEGIITGAPMAAPPILIRTRLKTIAPRSKVQIDYMRALVRDDVIFALGPAGTGKTYLAVAQAVSQLMSGSVQRLILSRPAVEAGERLGFLPGDMKEKVDPYLRPLYDALYDCMPPEQVERRMASGEIEVAPIAFMRGRTLADAFVILDEAQNTTVGQMKMFLTRFGQNSRMVVCGDPRQVDLPGGVAASGLADAVRRLEGIEGIGTVRFGVGDVVRHPIVGRIVEAYEGQDSADTPS
ncbi:PhoH family protein [Novosphingobium acidiphilum]|jgi:phosphate starvation-inducible PhoH-like protein|uniref:PhoH family protein n=1 Tax=Novosphingobium acidiphilum TaxID=505248 RepID=UPI0004061B08|nr:PhoH family protein [Novosphingobium acidiphilum]